MALLIADIDHFKCYNDTLGHPQGDLCLVKVARGLQEGIFRPGDFVTRYGGTVSIGVAATVPSRERDPAILLEAADQALYDAKTGGRNCIAGRHADPSLRIASNS